MKLFFILLILQSLLFGEQMLTIATYNVENLFDLKRSGHEYKEYIPYSSSHWNKRTYTIKLKHISQVIKSIHADIIALEEIESLQALKDLRYQLKRDGLYYKYYKIANLKNTTVKVALLSKVPFVYTHEIAVQSSYKFRNILEVKFKVGNENLYVLVNHWKAKSGPESMRIVSARKLMKRVKELGADKNIIALGDFNSHYEEYKTFKRKRRLNNTDGITGINHILGTINYQKSAEIVNLDNYTFYNLWYDIPEKERYTYIFHGKKEALDSILVTKTLLDNKGLDYKKHSLHTYHPYYLFKRKSIYRWQMSRKYPQQHKGKGYSDHLPLIAEFIY